VEHLVFEIGLAALLMAMATWLASRLKLSVVPLLIIIGLAVGPHLPHFGLLDLRFIESKPIIDFMGRLGMLFLLFYLGLEFSLGRLLRAGYSIAMSGTIYIAINLTLGLLFGRGLGWPVREIMVVAGITTISSSAIVAKVITDLRRSARPETGLILGIIMFEDVFLAAYMALVSGFVLHGSTSLGNLATSITVTALFIVTLLAVGRYSAPYLNQWLRAHSEESFVLFIFAILFVIAGLSETVGVAEAIGALLIGLVLGETEQLGRLERVVIPFRDFFGAFLFFSFGLNIDPLALGGAVAVALAAALMTIAGNFVAGLIAGKISRLPANSSVNIGLTIVSRGEFSIVLASLAQSGGLLAIIQPFTAVYVLALSILGPILTKNSGVVYNAVEWAMNFSKSRLSKKEATNTSSSPNPGPAEEDPAHGSGDED
jgi:monovalent cation:H+ antiporter-2, CPA2 family